MGWCVRCVCGVVECVRVLPVACCAMMMDVMVSVVVCLLSAALLCYVVAMLD